MSDLMSLKELDFLCSRSWDYYSEDQFDKLAITVKALHQALKDSRELCIQDKSGHLRGCDAIFYLDDSVCDCGLETLRGFEG